MNQNIFIFYRNLANNNWDCPIPDYSSISNNDYDQAKILCGNNINFVFSLFFYKNNNKK